MVFTSLEAALISFSSALVVGVVVKVFVGREKVNCTDCAARHEALETQMRNSREKDHADHERMMRMLRSLITYSAIPPEKKEAILNDSRARGE